MIVALAGGVGGARLGVGLASILKPSQLAFVVNTGDDFEHHGLTICPDLDTMTYTLGGVSDAARGWGRADETWSFMDALRALGGEAWFQLGDRDLAVHVLRTELLRNGVALSEVTRRLTRTFRIRHAILPMSETPVRTMVKTPSGEISFQDYFVRLRCKPRVTGFRFAGSRGARVPTALHDLMTRPVDALIICPSNPYISIGPILAVREIRDWIRRRDFPVVGVSPIVGGAAIKGPAAKMMKALRADASALGVARHYGKIVDGWIIDRQDQKLAPAIEREGCAVHVTDTIMSTHAKSVALARHVLSFANAVIARRRPPPWRPRGAR